MSYGYFYVAKEIETGTDPRFDDYRRKPIVKRLLIDFENPGVISIDEALLLAREVFTATYRRYPEVKAPLTKLELEHSPLSNTMDSARVS